MRRAELAVAAVWFAVGATVAVASWRMDRLADRAIEPWSAPGLLPGVIGLLLMAFASVVAWRAWRAGRADAAGAAVAADAGGGDGTLRRTAIAAALCLAFALSLGHGLPFMASGAVFVFAFTSVFAWRDWQAAGRVGRGVAGAAAVAVATTVAIALLFERVFLVRLP